MLLRDVDWSPIYSKPSVDEQVAFFKDANLQLFDEHISLRCGSRKSNFNQ
jgi:hypothetical protein